MKKRHRPERTCIVCRGKFYKDELTRLVLVNQVVVRDEKQRLPGRGAYVCRDCIGHAKENYRGCLNRAFRTGNILGININ